MNFHNQEGLVDESSAKEQFSYAYAHAISSIARFSTYKPFPDDDSIDIGFAAAGGKGTYRSPWLEAQLKCTSQEILFKDDLRFPLKMKNYNDLREEKVHVPRILIVVIAPKKLDDFLLQSEESLILKHCAYWHSLRGYEEKNNSSKVTVTLSRKNIFSVETLISLMSKIGEGQTL